MVFSFQFITINEKLQVFIKFNFLFHFYEIYTYFLNCICCLLLWSLVTSIPIRLSLYPEIRVNNVLNELCSNVKMTVLKMAFLIAVPANLYCCVYEQISPSRFRAVSRDLRKLNCWELKLFSNRANRDNLNSNVHGGVNGSFRFETGSSVHLIFIFLCTIIKRTKGFIFRRNCCKKQSHTLIPASLYTVNSLYEGNHCPSIVSAGIHDVVCSCLPSLRNHWRK